MGLRRARRQGMVVGAAVASSRAKNAAAAQQPAPASVPNASSGTDIDQIKQLAELKDQGILTQEEFDAKKKQILGL
ncbi:SHOCT domain-containing protein [Candidatus Saccharibacteria bacterium]|nr:SHOCT domain-containing protein [Candidatus Saccharibacteria bacterium]